MIYNNLLLGASLGIHAVAKLEDIAKKVELVNKGIEKDIVTYLGDE